MAIEPSAAWWKFIAAFPAAEPAFQPVAAFDAMLMSIGCFAIARIEEGFLREQLGAEAYGAYAAHVPMLVPFLPTRSSNVRH
jgi:protein-S-isoprenylcysteine O-methyltransferase Ste14